MGICESRRVYLRRMLQCSPQFGSSYFPSEASATFFLESNFTSGSYEIHYTNILVEVTIFICCVFSVNIGFFIV